MMKTRLIFSAALFSASLFLNELKAQNFTDPVNITTNLDAVLNFNNTDGAWQYIQFKTNGIRKAYLGLDGNGTDFIFGKENGGSFIFAGANLGIGISTPSAALHIKNDEAIRIQAAQGLGWIGQIKMVDASINGGGAERDDMLFSTPGGFMFKMDNNANGVSSIQGFNIYDRNDNSVFVVKESTGNIGLGTDSPSQVLEIENLNPVINIKTTRDGTNAYGYIDFNDVDSKMGHIGFVSTTKDNFTIYNAIGNIIIPAGDVGIGTNSPNSKLHVIGEVATSNSFLFRKDDGSGTAGLSMSGTGTYIHVQGQGLIGHSDNTQDLGITGLRFRNLKLGGTALINGSVGIGTTDAGAYKLAVEGQIGARSVKVTQALWADYVFASSYELMPLEQVEAYIQKNQHLPNVASAQEIEQDGFILEEMDAKLMEKIEELTLYVIELQKENKQQANQISQLQAELAKVQKNTH